jgi:hypothetical protein
MQLRFLKRARSRSNVWPPTGDGHGLLDTPRFREDGVLTGVRIGDRLSVTIHFDGHDHIVSLQPWAEPPTLAEVHTALRTMARKRVWEVGQVDIAEGRERDEAGY